MASPFPGMNPYLETPAIWEDFHSNLAIEIQTQLAPNIRPRYVAAITPRMTYESIAIERPITIKPDIGVMRPASHSGVSSVAVAVAPAPVVRYMVMEVPVKLFSVEIREAGTGFLVTAIEILSPVNKRRGHEAFDDYSRKRRDLLRSGAHLIEVDLLRAGARFPNVTDLPEAPYYIFLSRADQRPRIEIWPLNFQNVIPPIPVPLIEPDPDVYMDLSRAVQSIYERASYDLRIDYSQPPPKPDLPPEDASWIASQLQAQGLRQQV